MIPEEKFSNIEELYSKFKRNFCKECCRYKEDDNCLYLALCFLSHCVNDKAEPHYFSSSRSETANG